MGRLNINQIKPGMKLEKDVQERSGRVLLRAGTEITERHLNILMSWGVSEADIESASREEAEAERLQKVDPEILKKAEEQVRPLFAHADQDHPAVRELMRLSVLRRAGVRS